MTTSYHYSVIVINNARITLYSQHAGLWLRVIGRAQVHNAVHFAIVVSCGSWQSDVGEDSSFRAPPTVANTQRWDELLVQYLLVDEPWQQQTSPSTAEPSSSTQCNILVLRGDQQACKIQSKYRFSEALRWSSEALPVLDCACAIHSCKQIASRQAAPTVSCFMVVAVLRERILATCVIYVYGINEPRPLIMNAFILFIARVAAWESSRMVQVNYISVYKRNRKVQHWLI